MDTNRKPPEGWLNYLPCYGPDIGGGTRVRAIFGDQEIAGVLEDYSRDGDPYWVVARDDGERTDLSDARLWRVEEPGMPPAPRPAPLMPEQLH